MKLAMTVVVRNEADIIEHNLRYHLDAGVDFIVATDHRSDDGTSEILERYERDGVLHLIREDGQALRQTEWVTHMAQLAATKFGADWVINTDADEFWWPHRGSLREVFAAVPRGYGALRGIWRHFALRPDDAEPFYERMVVRRPPANDPADPYCANAKVVHRGEPNVRVSHGNHDAFGEGLALLREWVPFEVLHFPIRSREHLLNKYVAGRASRLLVGPELVPAHFERLAESLQDEPESLYRELLVDDAALGCGRASGALTVDERLRDQLRGETSRREPSVPEDVAFAEEIDAMLTMDSALRLAARADSFEKRLAAVEAKRSWVASGR